LTDAPQSAGLVALADRIELWPIDHLRPYERNPRTHSATQVDEIAASMVEFGWTNPILIDENAGELLGVAHPAAGVCSGRQPWSTFIVWAKHTLHPRACRLPTPVRADTLRLERGQRPLLMRRTPPGRRVVLRQARPKRPAAHHEAGRPSRAGNSSKTRDIVLDPFGGSGPTLIACEKTGRQARLIELDPKYCDVMVERWQRLTGKTARPPGSLPSGEPTTPGAGATGE
jgi:DNA methylase/ParB/Sulfiredoxin domain